MAALRSAAVSAVRSIGAWYARGPLAGKRVVELSAARVHAELVPDLAPVLDHEVVERRAHRVGDAVVEVEHAEHRAGLDEQARARRGDEPVARRGRVGVRIDDGVDELDQELAVCDAAITRALARDDADVGVMSGPLAARTERHRMRRRSIEAVVPERSA